MRTRLGLAALLLLPGLAWAQTPPETVLPAHSQVYFRWDGIKAHDSEYSKTAVGKMMKGELGKFFAEFGKHVGKVVNALADKENEPRIAEYYKDGTRVLSDFYQFGFVVGIELEKTNPPVAHAVMVFPKAAGENGALLPLLPKIAEAAGAEVKDVKVGKRIVHQIDLDKLQLGWWVEGDDAVLYAGTSEPSTYAKGIGDKTGLKDHALYTRLGEFKEFPTVTRGYVDVKGIAKVVSELSPEAAKFVDELGVKGIASLTFVSGFDGVATRSVSEMETVGTRKGLLSLSSKKTITLKDLPALPGDIHGFTASSMDLGKSYEVLVKLVEVGTKIFAPEQADTVQQVIKTAEAFLGVNLKDDVFDQFGNTFVSYSSPVEGPLGLGTVAAFEVKDGKKLLDSLQRMTKAAGFVPGLDLKWRKVEYKGGQVLQLSFSFGGSSSLIGSFGLYKNWFVYSQFPQPIKGFIMRAEGDLPTWQPDAKLTKILDGFPQEFTYLSISDPRQSVEGLLSVTPFVINLANAMQAQFLPGVEPFDLLLIPHPLEISGPLFPNVTVATDDGRKIRSETRASLSFP